MTSGHFEKTVVSNVMKKRQIFGKKMFRNVFHLNSLIKLSYKSYQENYQIQQICLVPREQAEVSSKKVDTIVTQTYFYLF